MEQNRIACERCGKETFFAKRLDDNFYCESCFSVMERSVCDNCGQRTEKLFHYPYGSSHHTQLCKDCKSKPVPIKAEYNPDEYSDGKKGIIFVHTKKKKIKGVEYEAGTFFDGIELYRIYKKSSVIGNIAFGVHNGIGSRMNSWAAENHYVAIDIEKKTVIGALFREMGWCGSHGQPLMEWKAQIIEKFSKKAPLMHLKNLNTGEEIYIIVKRETRKYVKNTKGLKYYWSCWQPVEKGAK